MRPACSPPPATSPIRDDYCESILKPRRSWTTSCRAPRSTRSSGRTSITAFFRGTRERSATTAIRRKRSSARTRASCTHRKTWRLVPSNACWPPRIRMTWPRVRSSESGRMAPDSPPTIRHPGGGLTDVLYNASVYNDAGGEVLGVFAAARDVTAQKRAESEVAKQRARELDRLAELERFQKLTVGRELRMIELKKEIEDLRAAAGSK